MAKYRAPARGRAAGSPLQVGEFLFRIGAGGLLELHSLGGLGIDLYFGSPGVKRYTFLSNLVTFQTDLSLSDKKLHKLEMIQLKEITTPTASPNYGQLYTKADNKLYFQDGAGAEHEVKWGP